MKLTKLGFVFIGSVSFALITNGWMLNRIQHDYRMTEAAQNQRLSTVQLTTSIEKDVQQLSQFVRAYTSSGETRYLIYYYDLISIRNGEKSKPLNYSAQYWADVMAGNIQHQMQGKKGVALNALLLSMQFSVEEQKIAEQILETSSEMAEIESVAFAATQGLYDPVIGDFVDDGEPNLVYAASLVNGEVYLKLNSQLIGQVEHLSASAIQRTADQVSVMTQRLMNRIFYAALMLFVSVGLMVLLMVLVRRNVLKPMQKMIAVTSKFGQGEYQSRLIVVEAVDELKQVAHTFNEMAANIENDIHRRSELLSDLQQAKKTIEEVHLRTRESIEYASLIQHALIPDNTLFESTFSDYFCFWEPKDVVGGDIYFFSKLRNDDESLLLVIDCTGHGVPGAFVTMLVKAVEQQIVTQIQHSHDEVQPNQILKLFNQTLKKLLKQESLDSVSNAGFDGAAIYYNQQQNIIRFSGAQTALHYWDGSNLTMIKGDRHSVGYKKTASDTQFSEHEVCVKPGMRFYVTTDGYLDQNGGDKGFPFGRRRYEQALVSTMHLSIREQQIVLQKELGLYQSDEIRNDDVTIIGFIPK
ncbi:PP2C family protein-serine/threonine phosphatase [Thiomicrospira microaerophila]|uniref:PP2C family protein-serine/threonine phosphatase n=1 Tax=Thiomicrospira microaerophila TaxID=406020 RepID=UPI0005C96C81|nr:SpoIIE family protein phosphatase [Thiomicrospira microaerophila]